MGVAVPDLEGDMDYAFRTAHLSSPMEVLLNVLRETGFANPQVDRLQYTLATTSIAFFVFAFAPKVMRFAWAWVPYANRRGPSNHGY
jgi:hypothetical protein